ncbi:MAG: DUF362 domain-containing protein [Erysipelotrichaceae bacterium]
MSKVYFSKEISSAKILEMYKLYEDRLADKVAVKVHSGEDGNQNFLHPEFFKPVIDYVGGTVVECNTAYDGERNTSAKHIKLLKNHGWSEYFKVDLMDQFGPDAVLEVKNGFQLDENYVGKNLMNYDSMLVLSHFKGHPMGGFGGAIKQLSIGCASAAGKAYIHSAGQSLNVNEFWGLNTPQDKFLEAMADAASSVVQHFAGKLVFVNVMANLSVDCDCCSKAEDPCMKDIGVLVSDDSLAIDQACVDLIYNSTDEGRDHFVERIETRHGLHTLEAAEKLNFGSREYQLIEL